MTLYLQEGSWTAGFEVWGRGTDGTSGLDRFWSERPFPESDDLEHRGYWVAVIKHEGSYYGHRGPLEDFTEDDLISPPFDTAEECAQWLTMMEATHGEV